MSSYNNQYEHPDFAQYGQMEQQQYPQQENQHLQQYQNHSWPIQRYHQYQQPVMNYQQHLRPQGLHQQHQPFHHQIYYQQEPQHNTQYICPSPLIQTQPHQQQVSHLNNPEPEQQNFHTQSHDHQRGQSSTVPPQKSSYVKPPSPLNDFGDMGAAVRKYAEADPNKICENNLSSVCDNDFPKIEDNNPYRRAHGLTVWDNYNKNVSIPEPFQRFEDFKGLSHSQLNAFYSAGFLAPTPIQAQTWPIVLNNRDVVSIAKTGSGKTLAFLLPAYRKIQQENSQRNIITALVLAPTRELATQIQEEAEKFGRIAGFYCACAYGGASKKDQLQTIRTGVSVLVATPGRLNDFIDSNQVDISSVSYLVLDEADRMLDMGFEPQIRSIIRRVPRHRQTLMFSATWPEEVRRLANDFLNQPIHIRLGGLELGLRANENIQQHLILLRSGEDKDNELIELIKSRYQRKKELVLIFVARKNTCDFVANMLNRVGIRAAAMHGDRDQSYREKTLAAFRDGTRAIMVATDVASRGIDVKGISAVINYDLANSSEDYVHRIGRTGRAGMVGESFTFITHSYDDIWKVMGIVEVMAKTNQHPPQEVQQMIDQMKRRQEQNLERRAVENEQFQKVLIVAEKPSVAKMVAEHLSGGRFRTRRGQSPANQIFECIKWFQPAQQKCKLMITSVVGHIFSLNFKRRGGRDVAELFNAEVEKVVEDSTKKLRVVEHLQELGQESDFLFLWLDCDREGENIGFEVISLTQQWVHYDNVYRARFSALTKTELVLAYENPVRPDKYAAMSVDARQELDLKIGVAFSRLMTKTFLDMAKEKFRLKDQKVISYGPCQTPTLWFCVERHREIQKFRPQTFYNVSVIATIQGQRVQMKWVEEYACDQARLQKMEAHVQSARVATVVNVEESERIVAKPLGLNTVTLLKACSKGLGMSPTAAMQAAEHLYTSGYISYPRTETTAYPPSFDLRGCLEEQANHPNWGRTAQHLLRSGCINVSDKGFDVGDHPPITPMRSASREEFNKGNEWRIYDYVTRHFIASLHDDMTFTERKLLVDIAGYQFYYTWHEVVDRGFINAMPWKLKSLNLNESRLNTPPYGSSIPVTNFLKEEDATKPPDYLQESELITLMDKHGIGTDASIPQHIKNVQERHYLDVCGPGENGQRGQIIQQKKFFGKNNRGGHQQNQERPTSRHMVPRGFGLAFLSCFEELDKELCEPSIRAYMEEQVSKIATGETEKNEVVSSNLKLFHEKFLFYRENLERCNKYFAPKVYDADGNVIRSGSNEGFGRDRGRGGMNTRGHYTGRGGYGKNQGGGEGFNGNQEESGESINGNQGRRGGFNGDQERRAGFNGSLGGRGGGLNANQRGRSGFNGNQRGRGAFNRNQEGRDSFNGNQEGRGGFKGNQERRGGFNGNQERRGVFNENYREKAGNFNKNEVGNGDYSNANYKLSGVDDGNHLNNPDRARNNGVTRGRGNGRGRDNNSFGRGNTLQNTGQKRGGYPMILHADKKTHHSY